MCLYWDVLTTLNANTPKLASFNMFALINNRTILSAIA